jgi:hypothetical protein
MKPLQSDSKPCCLTVCATILDNGILLSWPPEAASCMTLVFRLSPGVTTKILSVVPAQSPAVRSSQGFLVELPAGPKKGANVLFAVSNEKNLMPLFSALLMASV